MLREVNIACSVHVEEKTSEEWESNKAKRIDRARGRTWNLLILHIFWNIVVKRIAIMLRGQLEHFRLKIYIA